MGSHDSIAPGRTLGRYVIHHRLGAGGMGAVYAAVHQDLRKQVAVKVLRHDIAQDPLARARFLREGEAAAKLRHPNVVDIFDVGIEDGIPYLVMEFLEGEDLGHRLVHEGSVAPDRLLEWLLPVCDAVAAAHEAGIVHRDLKPANIFLARTRHSEQEPKLLDFGISKIADARPGPTLTATNSLMGTTMYMSPEQAVNGKDVDVRADQYSLGVILYECATGQHPFREFGTGESLYVLLNAIVAGRFKTPRTLRPELPEAFEAVVLKAMSSERDERYESVRALAQALLPFASEDLRATWERRLARVSEAPRVVQVQPVALSLGVEIGTDPTVAPHAAVPLGESAAVWVSGPLVISGSSDAALPETAHNPHTLEPVSRNSLVDRVERSAQRRRWLATGAVLFAALSIVAGFKLHSGHARAVAAGRPLTSALAVTTVLPTSTAASPTTMAAVSAPSQPAVPPQPVTPAPTATGPTTASSAVPSQGAPGLSSEASGTTRNLRRRRAPSAQSMRIYW